MRKKYLFTSLFLFFTAINSCFLNAVEIQKSNIHKDAYVILLGTYMGINDAKRFATTFENEKIYILKDNDTFTVRIVNIKTKKLALAKLDHIKKSVPDAILWKKMIFLKEDRFNKLHSQIYTIDSNKDNVIKEKAEG